MKQILAATIFLLAVAPIAHAGPVSEPQRDLVVSRQHDYWLSDRLNRLVFWKAPATERDQTRRQ